ncbi:hypothetical protein QA639_34720 [Bradyrhizobium pachyrhizi]|uniref:hypothetical protein n=1 Tax=Bradyrhizobium pachyrhizi TaxID=280333 RepID=UPI0024B1ACEA|nr:hypothetical protein [Bradyrhizobium pachyrhizi]WFU54698.1 hypothetical protein QA639_34720 [Bradyrhizobium pachyrhizi]
MSTWEVALVREQGVEFGVVAVQDHVISNPSERDNLVRMWVAELGRPVVLLGGRRHQTYGRHDIVNWLSSVDPARLPWRQVTIN